MKTKNIFVLLLILGTAFWGISFPVTKTAIAGGSHYTFLFYRFFLATLILSVLFFKSFSKINKDVIRNAFFLSLPLTFGISLQTIGVKMTSASQCAFIAGICVIIIPVIKVVFYKSTLDKKIWLAAVIALLGLMIISVNGNFTVGLGDLYTFAGALGFSIYLIRVERYSHQKNIVPTIVPMFFFCTIIMSGFALLDDQAVWISQSENFWSGILYCAIFSTAYMYTISNISQKYISAEKVAIIYLFEPIFAALASYIILDESLSLKLLLGGSLIFTGTLISELRFKKKVKLKA
ncbi:DMT family transporter [Chryseobacterium scophthalmum]|uniref:DMT family transporter n=1 Tax=Chryseobacterium scophthalmum TaxID=59733 RepID=UPI001AEBF632|nr:DMT family transporter [Chryseobacterium scophthalmum]